MDQLGEAEQGGRRGRALLPLLHTLFARSCTGRMRIMDDSDDVSVVRLYGSALFKANSTDAADWVNWKHMWNPIAAGLRHIRLSLGTVRRVLRR